jgi:1-Cys peroxiredoxin 6
VCTTELSRTAQLVPEFGKRNVKLIALSCDSVDSHAGWIKDIQAFGSLSGDFPFPIIDDEQRELAVKLNMLDKDEIGSKGLPLTCRAVFIIDSSKKLRASLLYPASSGRNFDEILRLVDSMQLTDRNKVATPVDWKKGGWCMVLPTVKNEDIPSLYPKGVEHIVVPSGKQYIRKTPCPE